MLTYRDRGLLRISHRAAGVWGLFAAWLAVLVSIGYGRMVATQASTTVYMGIITGGRGGREQTAAFTFLDEASHLVSNATMLLLMLLMVATFRPRYRMPIALVSFAGALALVFGYVEKFVYHRWTQSNESLLAAEGLKRSALVADIGIDRWFPSVDVVGSMDLMVATDVAVMTAAFLWAVIIKARLSVLRSGRAVGM